MPGRASSTPGGAKPGRSVDGEVPISPGPSALDSPAGSSISAERSRQALALITSPSESERLASTSSTLRPGRTTRASTRSGAIGTARRISNVILPTCRSPSPSSRSISRPIRAAGGPACWESGSQGPRVSSVGA